jgi:RNA polymerase sigma-70 factor (ECF subfamily)
MEMHASMAEKRTSPELLDACRRGDRDAMREVYDQNQRRVFSVAMNYFGGNRQMAEDITQKVFLKLLIKMEFDGRSEFTTWLYRVTVNACTDEARKMTRFVDIKEFFGLSGGAVQQLRAESGDVSEKVQIEIGKLKPKYRLPIVLKYSEGLSYNEIAEVLAVSIGTVSSRLNRGHKMLATKLAHLRGAI